MTSGYSGKPLADKLGIKPQMRIALLNTPGNYDGLLGALPPGVDIANELEDPCDLIHAFYVLRGALQEDFPRLKLALAEAGSLWISWPRKASKVETDLDENLIREIGLSHGLVDVKVAAVDPVWSALKFVRRLKDRHGTL
jgi:hypothetical protein